MTELSKSDQELVKLRAAKMSTKSIAMLMGGRWTEAKVYNRLAQIDGQTAASIESYEAACRDSHGVNSAPPAVQLAQARSTPWLRSALSFVEANGDSVARSSVFQRGPSLAAKSEFFLSWPIPDEPCLETLPLALDVEEAPLEPAAAVDGACGDHTQPQAPSAPLAASPSPRKPRVPRQAKPQVVAVLAQPSAPVVVRPPAGASVRLRPVTDRIIGFAARFAAARWPLEEIAELFDVSPEQLEKVLA